MSDSTMTDAIRVGVGQMHPVPFDVEANLATIGCLVRAAAGHGAQLLVLPETATTGYFIADRLGELAEPDDGPTATHLSALAREARLHLVCGMALAEEGRFYDAQLLFGPDGSRLATYRKAHLFAAERRWYAAGDTPVVVDTALGRLGLTVCYDLIFPEYIRALTARGAELVINSTNWIADDWQRATWDWNGPMVEALARTRALENGIFLAMANCIGQELHFTSLGHSAIVAPSGQLLASAGTVVDRVIVADIVRHSADLTRWREIATYRPDRRPELYGGEA
ncbi:MAG: carbon-nitrogen hydrolase family protein [Acidobacteria bacterium]|nr:carbon-nitrogen hydrolase family protein [Acidobacteriota bacterium]